mmetsp:Transcript_13220/g.41731  ORF Transcript_13220/g.41731 Transcript_13220/m.41731 type:complete len:204 (-) Transcript_13220:224-835(-)
MACQGTVKSFNPAKSYGFIEYQGTDVFVHIKDCSSGVPRQGDVVTFDIEDSPTKPGSKKASNVSGGSGAMKGVMGGGSCQGRVKSFNPVKGFGFIEYQGADVFVHSNDCHGGLPCPGDTVAFDIEESPSKPGTKKAANVTGGSQSLDNGKGWGKGGGKGWGKAMDYGPAWGGGWNAGGWWDGGWGVAAWTPYSYGKGKGKGKW